MKMMIMMIIIQESFLSLENAFKNFSLVLLMSECERKRRKTVENLNVQMKNEWVKEFIEEENFNMCTNRRRKRKVLIQAECTENAKIRVQTTQNA
jgi:hypothetical protein